MCQYKVLYCTVLNFSSWEFTAEATLILDRFPMIYGGGLLSIHDQCEPERLYQL